MKGTDTVLGRGSPSPCLYQLCTNHSHFVFNLLPFFSSFPLPWILLDWVPLISEL